MHPGLGRRILRGLIRRACRPYSASPQEGRLPPHNSWARSPAAGASSAEPSERLKHLAQALSEPPERPEHLAHAFSESPERLEHLAQALSEPPERLKHLAQALSESPERPEHLAQAPSEPPERPKHLAQALSEPPPSGNTVLSVARSIKERVGESRRGIRGRKALAMEHGLGFLLARIAVILCGLGVLCVTSNAWKVC